MSPVAAKLFLLIAMFLATCVQSTVDATCLAGVRAAQANVDLVQLDGQGNPDLDGLDSLSLDFVDPSGFADGECAKALKLKADSSASLDELLESHHHLDHGIAGQRCVPPGLAGVQDPCTRIDFELRPPIA